MQRLDQIWTDVPLFLKVEPQHSRLKQCKVNTSQGLYKNPAHLTPMYKFPFKQLVSFEAYETIFSEDDIWSISDPGSSLESLVLSLGDRNTDMVLAPLVAFPNLKRLRLYLHTRHPLSPRIKWSIPPTPILALTHLSLYNFLFEPSKHIETCLNKLSFPNLRVFDLQRTKETVSSVFDFVNRHPTILELNLHFFSAELVRFEALPKLIAGTGTWVRPRDPQELAEYSRRIAQGRVDEATKDAAKERRDNLVLPDIPNTKIYVKELAFCRRPLSPAAIAHSSSVGSSEPRLGYEATALAFRVEDVQSNGVRAALMKPHFELIARLFPALEELRILGDSMQEQHQIWVEWMDDISEAVAKLKQLRRFTISSSIDDELWDWTHDRSRPEERIEKFWPYVDCVAPPCRTGYEYWYNTLSNIRENSGEFIAEEVADIVAETLGIPKHELDQDDEQLLMYTWEARHQRTVERIMRQLAERCSRLEQIEWYPSYDLDYEDVVLWRWEVLRNVDASVRMVNGHLTWTCSIRGSPVKLSVRVGEELQYHNSLPVSE